MYAYCNNNYTTYFDTDGHGIGLIIFGLALGTIFVVNSINKIKNAKNEINKVQKKKNVSDKTKKFDETMKQNAATLQKQVKGQSPVEKLATFRNKVTNGSIYDLKLTEEWNTSIKYNNIIMEPQDIGNFHYGYIGRSIGIPHTILYGGAGLNQLKNHGKDTIDNCFTIGFCDDLRNTIFIRAGAIKYDTEN